MYKSLFSFNITRPYPFRWFTPVVIVGGVVAFALVSFLNVAAAGYELHTVSSDNYDDPQGSHTWLDRWPSFFVSTRASCQPATIPLHSQIYTNNTALLYTLNSVWNIDATGQQASLGSLVYKNQPLQSCNVSSVSIDIETNERSGGQIAMIPVGGVVTAEVDCRVDDDTYLTLLGTYDPIPPPPEVTTAFIVQNKTSRASLYWGQSLMRIYWANLMMEYYWANYYDDDYRYNGVVHLSPNLTTSRATVEEVSSEDFFNIGCFFNHWNQTGIAHWVDSCYDLHNVSSLSKADSAVMPDIWTSVGILGKATYFTVLTDIGRNDTAIPNMLADPNLLADLSSNLTNVNQSLTSLFRWGVDGDLAMRSFDPAVDSSAGLGVQPSVLATNYICEIPQLKTPGSLIVSVLVADLVFLQALWTILRLVVDTFWISKEPGLRNCEGCAQSSQVAAGADPVTKEHDKCYVEVSQKEEERPIIASSHPATW